MARCRDTDALLALAGEQGFAVSTTTQGRVRIVPPNPDAPIIIATPKPRDPHSVKNLRAQLRRAGLQDRPPKKKTIVPDGMTPPRLAEETPPVPTPTAPPARRAGCSPSLHMTATYQPTARPALLACLCGTVTVRVAGRTAALA